MTGRQLRWGLRIGLGIVLCAVLAGAAYNRWFRPVASDPGPDLLETRPVLEEEQRTYLWQVEHHVLVLAKYWFKDFAAALERADAKALEGMLAADFAGQTLDRPDEERLDTEFAKVVRRKDSGATPAPLSPSQFIAHLLDFRTPYRQAPKVRLNVKNLTPERREEFSGPWQGTGVLRMWGEAEPGQPREVVLHLTVRLREPAKVTRPAWLHACAITQSQVAWGSSFLLKDVTKARGVDPGLFHDNWSGDRKVPVTGGVYLCDFNRDGILDMLVTDVKQVVLYQGLPGGKFADVTDDVGLPRRITAPATAFIDIDGDGWDDLILGGRVYRNLDGKKFVDYSHACNLRVPEDTQGFAIADFDTDGRLDLYAVRLGDRQKADWLSGHSGKAEGNKLYRNLGDWQFEDVTARSGTDGGFRSTFTAAWLDADNDGRPDLYVPNEFGKGVLLLNNGDGTFRAQSLVDGPGDFGTMGMTVGDVDNDGHIDLYLANMYSKAGSRVIGNLKDGTYPDDVMARVRRFVSGSQLYLNRGKLRFDPRGRDWQMNDVGWAYGPLLVDLDNDGWLDLYATSGFMSVNRSEPDG
jgi:hypothetical protein